MVDSTKPRPGFVSAYGSVLATRDPRRCGDVLDHELGRLVVRTVELGAIEGIARDHERVRAVGREPDRGEALPAFVLAAVGAHQARGRAVLHEDVLAVVRPLERHAVADALAARGGAVE